MLSPGGTSNILPRAISEIPNLAKANISEVLHPSRTKDELMQISKRIRENTLGESGTSSWEDLKNLWSISIDVGSKLNKMA